MKTLCLGTLLLAASPIFSSQQQIDPQVVKGQVVWFTLEEDVQAVYQKLGRPAQVAEFGPGYVSMQYQIDSADKHDSSHVLMFRREDNRLISVTRTYDEPRDVDALFPADVSSTEYWPDSKSPKYSVRVRKLPGGRLLIAMGVARRGETTTQLMLIHESALKAFMPWLEARAAAVR